MLLMFYSLITDLCSVCTDAPLSKTCSFTFQNFKKLDLLNFTKMVEQSKFYINPPSDPNEFVQQMNTDFKQILDNLIPEKTYSKRNTLKEGTKPVWFTSDIISSKQKLRQLECRYKKTKTTDDFIAWKKYGRFYCKQIKEARNVYFKSLLSTAPVNKRWSIVNKLLHSTVISGYCSNCTLSATDFNEYFIDKIKNITVSISNKISNLVRFVVESHNLHMCLNEFTEVTLAEALQALSAQTKSSPLDIIPLHVMKSCPIIFSNIICNLVHCSFKSGIFKISLKQLRSNLF